MAIIGTSVTSHLICRSMFGRTSRLSLERVIWFVDLCLAAPHDYHWNESSDLLIHVWPHLTAIIGTSHLICWSMFGRTSRLSLERVIWFVDPCLAAPQGYHWNESYDLSIHVWPHLTAIIGTNHMICRSMFGRTSRLSLERVIWFVDPCLAAPHGYHWNESYDLSIHVWPHLTAIIGTNHLICWSMFGRTSRLSLERVIWFVDPCLAAPHGYHWNESYDLSIHVWPHLTAIIGTSHLICWFMFGCTSWLSLERIIWFCWSMFGRTSRLSLERVYDLLIHVWPHLTAIIGTSHLQLT